MRVSWPDLIFDNPKLCVDTSCILESERAVTTVSESRIVSYALIPVLPRVGEGKRTDIFILHTFTEGETQWSQC